MFPVLEREAWEAWGPHLQLHSWWPIPEARRDEFHTGHYHGWFVPQIPEQMIIRYTKPGDLVFDPFLGSGTTLIEAALLGRNGLGAELVPEVFEGAYKVIRRARKSLGKHKKHVHMDLHQGDWRPMELEPDSIQLTMFHPPYFDIIKFSDDPACWSNCESIAYFLRECRIAAHKILKATKPGGYICIVIGDCQDRENHCYRPLGFETLNQFQAAGWKCQGILVKDFGQATKGKTKNTNLWISRHVKNGTFFFSHEYIFVMRRPKK